MSNYIEVDGVRVIREEFRKRGHDAGSCDLQPDDDGWAVAMANQWTAYAMTKPYWRAAA
jgi:hypothetical protein